MDITQLALILAAQSAVVILPLVYFLLQPKSRVTLTVRRFQTWAAMGATLVVGSATIFTLIYVMEKPLRIQAERQEAEAAQRRAAGAAILITAIEDYANETIGKAFENIEKESPVHRCLISDRPITFKDFRIIASQTRLDMESFLVTEQSLCNYLNHTFEIFNGVPPEEAGTPYSELDGSGKADVKYGLKVQAKRVMDNVYDLTSLTHWSERVYGGTDDIQ